MHKDFNLGTSCRFGTGKSLTFVRTPVKEIAPRPIAVDELAVLEAALLRAPVEPISTTVIAGLRSLNVVGLCECGCKSVYFSAISRKDRRVADGMGVTASGKRVEVMVWANGDDIEALDIVDFESSGELPDPSSIST